MISTANALENRPCNRAFLEIIMRQVRPHLPRCLLHVPESQLGQKNGGSDAWLKKRKENAGDKIR